MTDTNTGGGRPNDKPARPDTPTKQGKPTIPGGGRPNGK